MAAFRLPRECIHEIDKLCSAFLWSGSELNPKKAKIAWEDVCKPKTEGGLGLRFLKEANEVCCLKLVWRLISNQPSLWVQWIKQNLLKKESFWAIKEGTSNGSWMWRKILKYRAIAKDLCKMEIRNGETASFWYDKWSDMGMLMDLVGPRGAIDMGIKATATVAEAWTTRRRRKHRIRVLNEIEDALAAKRQSREGDSADMMTWRGRDNKFKASFNTKDTWNHIRTTASNVTWHRGVWFTHATPKYSNRLSTGDRMCGWSGAVNPTCVLCSDPMETRDHLFFLCRFSAEIWNKLACKLLGNLYTTDWQTLVHYMCEGNLDRIQSFLARYIFQSSIYTIWRERNARRHGDLPNSPNTLIKFIDRQMRNQLLSIRSAGDKRYAEGLQKWFAVSN